MRENPYANTNKKPEELDYAGDNYIRYSGSTNKVYESQVFAWQASEKGRFIFMNKIFFNYDLLIIFLIYIL